MPGIDVDLVSRRLAEIKQLLGELRNVVELGIEKFLSDPYVRDAAKYKLIVAIESYCGLQPYRCEGGQGNSEQLLGLFYNSRQAQNNFTGTG